MANLCSICGKKEMLPYKCKFCGWTYCSEHRLPENHDCIGLEKFKEQSKESGKIVYQPVSETVRKRKIGLPIFNRGPKSPYAIPISRNYSIYIILISVVVFFLQLLIPGFTNLFLLIPQLFITRPWTIVTYMFLHAGIGHIFFNMLVLFFFGPILERKIGSIKFLQVYFGAGLLSAIGHMIISPSPVLGASGAIYGIFACLAVLDPEIRVFVYFIPMKIINALILFSLYDLLFIGSNDMIAHGAHLSGLLFGLYMGFKLKKERTIYSPW